MKSQTKNLTTAAIIAALYVVLTYVANLLGLASGAIQVRFSEALTILPLLTPAAIPGLTIGCVLANMLTGCAIWDIVFGSLATLIGAIGTCYFSNKNKWLGPIWPIAANTAIVPFVLIHVYQVPDSLGFLMLTVAIGEIISCGVLGLLLYGALQKTNLFKK